MKTKTIRPERLLNTTIDLVDALRDGKKVNGHFCFTSATIQIMAKLRKQIESDFKFLNKTVD